MAREHLTFRQRDITAAIKAVEASGHRVARVSIGRDGRIIVELALTPAKDQAPAPSLNPWDREYEDNQPP